MGWTTIADGIDVQAASFINEFIAAIQERENALGSGEAIATIAAGTDIQAATFWGEHPQAEVWGIQERIEDLVPYFVNKVAFPSGFDGETPPSPPTSNWMFTLSAWRSAIGLLGAGFRRATTWPTDWTDYADPAYSHGFVQPGDIIQGPWIWKDIQDGLNLLVWTHDVVALLADWEHKVAAGCANFLPTNWVDAKASAEADWPDVTSYAPQRSLSFGWNALQDPMVYDAGASRTYNQMRAAGVPNFAKSEVDFYIIPVCPGADLDDVFDTMGDGFAGYEDLWHKFATVANSDGDGDPETVDVGVAIGDSELTFPTWTAIPSEADVRYRGYQLDSMAGVIRWNVTDGFVYYSP
jgi:hypothetical protein